MGPPNAAPNPTRPAANELSVMGGSKPGHAEGVSQLAYPNSAA